MMIKPPFHALCVNPRLCEPPLSTPLDRPRANQAKDKLVPTPSLVNKMNARDTFWGLASSKKESFTISCDQESWCFQDAFVFYIWKMTTTHATHGVREKKRYCWTRGACMLPNTFLLIHILILIFDEQKNMHKPAKKTASNENYLTMNIICWRGLRKIYLFLESLAEREKKRHTRNLVALFLRNILQTHTKVS